MLLDQDVGQLRTPRPCVQRCDSGCLEINLLIGWSRPKAERVDGAMYGVVAPPGALLRERQPQSSYVVGDVRYKKSVRLHSSCADYLACYNHEGVCSCKMLRSE